MKYFATALLLLFAASASAQELQLPFAGRWFVLQGGDTPTTRKRMLPFQPDSFDVAFVVAVLGEVPDPKACVLSIARVLRAGGLLSVTELAGDPDALGEGPLRNLMQGTSLEFVESVRLPRGFIASFRRGF